MNGSRTAQRENAPGQGTRTRWLAFVLLAAAVTTVAVLANRWKSTLTVSAVQVRGNTIVPTREILSLAAVPKGAQLFGVDISAVQQRVLRNRFFRSVAVQRDVPNRVVIEVDERVPVAAIALERLLYLDAEGIILPPASSQSIFDLPVLSGDVAAAGLVPGRKTSDAVLQTALQILQLAGEIDAELALHISEIRIGSDRNVVFYTAEAGIPVILGRDSFGPKLVKFGAFWQSVVAKRGVQDLQYIDLRFDDQVVVRWTGDAAQVQS